jgi:hypothetical protein
MTRVEYLRQWRAKNPDKCKAYDFKTKLRMRAYHHTPKRKEYEKKYQQEHPELYSKSHKKYATKIRREEPWRWWHWQVKARCNNKALDYKKRGIKYQLSLNQIKTLWLRDKAWLLKRPSIDRIETTGNYSFENCRFIEHSVNMQRAKGKYHK